MELSEKTQQIIKQAPNWNFEGDCSLLEWMKEISEHLANRATKTSESLQQLDTNVKRTNIALENAANNLAALQHTQFVENRVADDEEPISKQCPNETINESKTVVTDVLKKFLHNNIEVLHKCHDKYAMTIDDSDEEDTEHTCIYQPKNPYHERMLPHIYGSKVWHEHWHVGLQDVSDDFSADENSDTFSESSSSATTAHESQSSKVSEWTSTSSLPPDKHGIPNTQLNSSIENILPPIPHIPVRRISEQSMDQTDKHTIPPTAVEAKSKPLNLFDEDFKSLISDVVEKAQSKVNAPVPATRKLNTQQNDLFGVSKTNEIPVKEAKDNFETVKNSTLSNEDDLFAVPKTNEIPAKKSTKKVENVNLFDEPKDNFETVNEDDLFAVPKTNEIPAKKSTTKVQSVNLFNEPKEKTSMLKAKNLFADDEDDDDDEDFLNVFKSKPKTSSATTKTQLFVDDDENIDLFGKKSQQTINNTRNLFDTEPPPLDEPSPTVMPQKSTEKRKNLFEEDDNDEDELFKTLKTKDVPQKTNIFDDKEKPIVSNNEQNSALVFKKNIFADETVNDEDDIFTKKIETREEKSTPVSKASIFDDETGDDDIFSNKIKANKEPSVVSTKKGAETNDTSSKKITPQVASVLEKKSPPVVSMKKSAEKDDTLSRKIETHKEPQVASVLEKKSPPVLKKNLFDDKIIAENDDDIFSTNKEPEVTSTNDGKETSISSIFSGKAIIDNDDDIFSRKLETSEVKSTPKTNIFDDEREEDQISSLNKEESLLVNNDENTEIESQNNEFEEKIQENEDIISEKREESNISTTSSKKEINQYANIFLDEPPEDDDLFSMPVNNVVTKTTEDITNDFYEEPLISASQESKQSKDYSGLTLFSDIPPDDDFQENINAKPTLIEQDLSTPKVETTSAKTEQQRTKPQGISKLQMPAININVKALLPGAGGMSNVRKSIEQQQQKETYSVINTTKESTKPVEESSNILTSVCKNRVRAPLNRRPSTRKGRKENYRQSLIAEATEQTINEADCPTLEKSPLNIESTSTLKNTILEIPVEEQKTVKNIFLDEENEDVDELFKTTKNSSSIESKKEKLTTEKNPKIKPNTVVDNLEKSDDLFGNLKKDIKKSNVSSIFDDNEDDDLFFKATNLQKNTSTVLFDGLETEKPSKELPPTLKKNLNFENIIKEQDDFADLFESNKVRSKTQDPLFKEDLMPNLFGTKSEVKFSEPLFKDGTQKPNKNQLLKANEQDDFADLFESNKVRSKTQDPLFKEDLMPNLFGTKSEVQVSEPLFKDGTQKPNKNQLFKANEQDDFADLFDNNQVKSKTRDSNALPKDDIMPYLFEPKSNLKQGIKEHPKSTSKNTQKLLFNDDTDSDDDLFKSAKPYVKISSDPIATKTAKTVPVKTTMPTTTTTSKNLNTLFGSDNDDDDNDSVDNGLGKKNSGFLGTLKRPTASLQATLVNKKTSIFGDDDNETDDDDLFSSTKSMTSQKPVLKSLPPTTTSKHKNVIKKSSKVADNPLADLL